MSSANIQYTGFCERRVGRTYFFSPHTPHQGRKKKPNVISFRRYIPVYINRSGGGEGGSSSLITQKKVGSSKGKASLLQRPTPAFPLLYIFFCENKNTVRGTPPASWMMRRLFFCGTHTHTHCTRHQ